MIKLMDHQKDVLEQTKNCNKVAYYLDMGLGKTFVGSEKAIALHKCTNLVICQKSKVDDWVDHFKSNYENITVYDLTNKTSLDDFLTHDTAWNGYLGYTMNVGIINYDLVWRRKELLQLQNFTLMLDESSLIQNPSAKRTKFILKLQAENIILLSGTPTSGKYENLWTQMHLLGWGISKDMYLSQYVIYGTTHDGYPYVVGYKNVERLKSKMRDYGCIFMKTEEVLTLPEQNFINIKVKETKEYNYFKKNSVVTVVDKEFIGRNTLTSLLYQRMLCGSYNPAKLEALQDLIESTQDRLIIFYNFKEEVESIKTLTDRAISIVNGFEKDLKAYEEHDNSITLIQYQAGSMGLNLQKANKIIYFTPTLSSDLFEQSKKRIHRIGQSKPCFYYLLKTGIEHRIYDVLSMRKDYTDKLFEEENIK